LIGPSFQATSVKLQIITLAAKLLVLCRNAEIIRLLSRYVFSLARYDINYDVRDRARMLASLLGTVYQDIDSEVEREDRGGVVLRPEQVKLVLFEGKSSMASTIEDLRKSHSGCLP
jgi:AP-3 complex subunit beta